jgi:hypothetical protein
MEHGLLTQHPPALQEDVELRAIPEVLAPHQPRQLLLLGVLEEQVAQAEEP